LPERVEERPAPLIAIRFLHLQHASKLASCRRAHRRSASAAPCSSVSASRCTWFVAQIVVSTSSEDERDKTRASTRNEVIDRLARSA
jgi:hypothetical protein